MNSDKSWLLGHALVLSIERLPRCMVSFEAGSHWQIGPDGQFLKCHKSKKGSRVFS